MKLPRKKVTVRTGDLNVPVRFYEVEPDTFEPNQNKETLKFRAYAQVYGSSQKDIEILNSRDAREGVTIKIRNTQGEFVPNNKQQVYIDDCRYTDKLWQIVDVRPDFQTDKFDVIVLGNPIYKNRDEIDG